MAIFMFTLIFKYKQIKSIGELRSPAIYTSLMSISIPSQIRPNGAAPGRNSGWPCPLLALMAGPQALSQAACAVSLCENVLYLASCGYCYFADR